MTSSSRRTPSCWPEPRAAARRLGTGGVLPAPVRSVFGWPRAVLGRTLAVARKVRGGGGSAVRGRRLPFRPDGAAVRPVGGARGVPDRGVRRAPARRSAKRAMTARTSSKDGFHRQTVRRGPRAVRVTPVPCEDRRRSSRPAGSHRAEAIGSYGSNKMDNPVGMTGRNVQIDQGIWNQRFQEHLPAVRIGPGTGFLFDTGRDGISEVRPTMVGRSAVPGANARRSGRAVT
jgi:hypothetical protein